MTCFPFAIVGFDLDGTLLDTREDLAAAVNHVLVRSGRAPLSVDRVTTMIGGGTRRLLERALAATGGCDDAMPERLEPDLTAFYGANIAVHTRPYAGAAAMLDVLAAKGVAAAVVTNKPERLARLLLDRIGWDARFACVIGGDTLPERKPSAVPIDAMVRCCGGGRAAFVGDTRYDIEAARAAGLPAIACRFGFCGDDAASLGAAAVIDHFDELVPALERLR